VSADIAENVYIGDRSVILEGSKIGEGSAIGPNSVVPPGRVIPEHQLWAGNPVRFVRDLTKSEMFSTKMLTREL
jgi:carbonic anhydrase/acetyltransferase-like protein (isoleucine patch superfamily)